MKQSLLKPAKRRFNWLYRDDFNDSLAAGSVNGTPAVPGPGTRTVVDTENKLSISGGQLVLSGGKAVPAYGDPDLDYGAVTRSGGLAMLIKVSFPLNTQTSRVGLNVSGLGGIGVNELTFGSVDLAAANATAVVGAYAANTPYRVAIILTTTGSKVFIKGGIYSEWTVLYNTPNDSTATLYPRFVTYNAALTADYLRVLQLPAPFDTDNGLATDVKAGAVATGTTFDHEADCLIEWTVTTLPSAGGISMALRSLSDTNNWVVYINNAGAFVLDEKIDGATTTRASASSGSIANGQRMVVICEGTTIKVYANNVLKITYASATNFAAETAGKLNFLGTGGAVSDLITHPRTISSKILDEASR